MKNYITYPFDLDEQTLTELKEWSTSTLRDDESKTMNIPVVEDETMDGFDGAAATAVVKFIISSVLSGAVYDIAKHIYTKLKAKYTKGEEPPGYAIQLEADATAYLYQNGKYYHLSPMGRKEVSEIEWLNGITDHVDLTTP